MSDRAKDLLRRPKLRWLLVAVTLGVALVAVRSASAPARFVGVTVDRRDIVETLVVVGRVRPHARAGLGAPLASTVTTIHVEEGERVVAGQLLASLDDREALAQIREAEAALSEVDATSTQALEAAELEARQAERDLGRFRAVFDEGALARQRLDEAEKRAADAASRLLAERARSGVRGDGATPRRARAALDAARARHALYRILAPASGIVLDRHVEAGDAVAAGQPLLELAFDGPSELVVFPGEERLGSLVVGAPALASADAYPDRSFEARVAFIAPVVDPTRGTIEVRLTLVDPPPYLLPDMTVSVNIETGRKTGALVLPEDAVQGLGAGEPWVGVIRDGRLVRQDVDVGLRAPEHVEIISGLAAGDVVTRGVSLDDVGRRARLRDPGGS